MIADGALQQDLGHPDMGKAGSEGQWRVIAGPGATGKARDSALGSWVWGGREPKDWSPGLSWDWFRVLGNRAES